MMHLSHLLLVLKDHLVRRCTHELSHDASISSPTCATMGCLRLVGSLKLQISFAKEPCQRDDILQKSHVILRSLLIVATPYISLASTSSPIQISFAKEPCSRDDILQKRPIILRSLLIVATPYISLASTSSPTCAEYSLFYMALLQKKPIILRSLLIVATPYILLAFTSSPTCADTPVRQAVPTHELFQLTNSLMTTPYILLASTSSPTCAETPFGQAVHSRTLSTHELSHD